MESSPQRKNIAPQRPKVLEPGGKKQEKHQSSPLCGIFGPFLAATSQGILGTVPIHLYTFIAKEGPKTRFMQLPLG